MRDTDPDTRESHRLTLGWAEKGIAAVLIASVIGVPSYLFTKLQDGQDAQAKTLQAVDTRTQVMAAQMIDVPAVRDKALKNEVRIDNLQRQVDELRDMRGLK